MKSGGITYAVIACGIDSISPSYTERNAQKIVESGGAIISEYRCGVKATPAYFPQRNRIISGISKAVIIVESGEKGGALITAEFAFAQQKEVFAIPGNITSDKSQGTNLLIKNQIASIALSPESVFEDLGFSHNLLSVRESLNHSFSTKSEESSYNSLTFEPKHIDAIAEDSGLEVSDLLVALLGLEFKGLIKQLPGNHYIKNK